MSKVVNNPDRPIVINSDGLYEKHKTVYALSLIHISEPTRPY